jgi:hypothetical protein
MTDGCYRSLRSWGLEALNGAITQPAWKSKPSWYLVAIDDRMIPPPAQRLMSRRPRAFGPWHTPESAPS